jgi:hypothetical protein
MMIATGPSPSAAVMFFVESGAGRPAGGTSPLGWM